MTLSPQPTTERRSLVEVAGAFVRLGLTSFGGPVAHIGALRAEIVQRRGWCTDAHFGELVALCQLLPGPASSQLVFALGMECAGIAGALLASVCFTLPSALAMIAFAIGVARVGDLGAAGWLHGLKVGAVAVVAQAVWGMARTLCPDRARLALCLAATAALAVLQGAALQLLVIAAGAALGVWLYREPKGERDAQPRPPQRHAAAAAALALFVGLLLALPLGARAFHTPLLAVFDAFYRAGALVFGGGHVVLPMLRAEVIPPGWVTDDVFLAGYAAVQAVPGPLFTFAAYLGAAMHPGPGAVLHGLWALLAIFLPAWLLVGGVLPLWQGLRARPVVQGAVAGANAAVVGVLLAALHRPVMTEALHTPWDALAAIAAFVLLVRARVPAWALVLLMAAAGQWILPR